MCHPYDFSDLRGLGHTFINGINRSSLSCVTLSAKIVVIMARFDLPCFERSVIQPLLRTKLRGTPQVNDPKALNCILWRLSVGVPGDELRAPYGLHWICVNRCNRWRDAGQ